MGMMTLRFLLFVCLRDAPTGNPSGDVKAVSVCVLPFFLFFFLFSVAGCIFSTSFFFSRLADRRKTNVRPISSALPCGVEEGGQTEGMWSHGHPESLLFFDFLFLFVPYAALLFSMLFFFFLFLCCLSR